ncbi:uncharacterized protein TM35_000511080 [Trypanosoma theileri]|uniref:Mucin-associated surface protein (MASP) n=1 Tax=Trypanosoma theileri TaxID=67003 RepID=A0A1X0NH81_9TRYP|nr:uncharacterized protein TM35_000511080 [Trypanosoma theileri]ORC84007.1 hypothetical protein TM35_000511080 [Trypanosoma theileri]
MMMMMMRRVMCVLAVVLCCACGYTMAAAAAVDNDSPSGRGVSRGAVEVSCGAGGALRVRPAAESEWLTCGAGSRVSACGKYADLCRQRTARAAATTTTATTTTAGQPKAVMAHWSSWDVSVAGWLKETGKDSTKGKPGDKKTEGTKQKNESESESHQLNEQLEGRIPQEVKANLSREEDGVIPEQQEQEVEVQHRQQPGENMHTLSQKEPNLVEEKELGHLSASSEVQEDLPHPEGTKRSPTVSADSSSSPEAASEARTTLSTATAISTAGEVNSNHDQPQTQSENNTESGVIKGSNTPHDAPAEAGDAATSGSEGSDAITPASTENTTTEAPSTAPSPAPVSNAEISNIASNMQNKANVDSSVSPVWMRTAAPLLIVAMLFSVTVY